MKAYHNLIAVLMLCTWLSAGCDGDKTKDKTPRDGSSTGAVGLLATSLLPPNIDAYQIIRSSEQREIDVAHLTEYVGVEAAAEYKLYSFEGLVAAGYTVRGTPLTVEVAQFASMDDAYGYYSRLRPDGVRVAGVGAESYRDGNSLYFVADRYAVTVSSETDDNESLQAQSLLAQEIASGAGHMRIPGFFSLYPSRWKVESSNHYYPRNYLGIPGLDRVYTVNYDLDGDTAVFFMTEDLAGEQFLKLRAYAETTGSLAPPPDSIPYYQGYAFMFDSPYQGRIVAGLMRAKLVGVVGFNEQSHLHLASLWVRGLQ
ncbi:MAG: DUF6599 family protein [bacterium]